MNINKILCFAFLIPNFAFADSLSQMVKEYDKKHNFDSRQEDKLRYIGSKDFKGDNVNVKAPEGKYVSFGEQLSVVDKRVKDARFKDIYYRAGNYNKSVGFDRDGRVGILDLESSTFPISKDAHSFGVRMEGDRCLTFFNVYKNDYNLKELDKIKNYKIVGVTEFIEVSEIFETSDYYGFKNNVSCSFYSNFMAYPSISTSVNFEYKPEHIEVVEWEMVFWK